MKQCLWGRNEQNETMAQFRIAFNFKPIFVVVIELKTIAFIGNPIFLGVIEDGLI